jgi:excisionase family DNA binding protein
MMVDELAEVFTPKEVAKALKLSEKTVLQYLREGRIPGFRVGKHWRVRRADLAALVQPEPYPVLVLPEDREPPHVTPVDLTPVQRKAALVPRLRALQAQGLSMQAIANQLNAEGVPTLSGRGHWQKGTVSDFLSEATARQ